MDELRRGLAANATPRQRALIEQVQRLADAKFAEMDRSVALVERGEIVGAEQAVLTDKGRELMDRLRATLGELEAIERASLAAAVAQSTALERRIVPLLIGLLGIIVAALALGLWQIVRAARAEAAAAQVTALTEARDRADLLARELNHRVKNIFAVILAVVRMSGKDTPEAKPAIDRITERIHALVTAHDVTQGSPGHPTLELGSLVDAVIAPYCSQDERCAVAGEPTRLPANAAMPLGLVLHELATNAVKYGAWSRPGGTVTVRWAHSGGPVVIEWIEHGDTLPLPTPEREGFGSLLMQSTARQLGGTISRTFGADGVIVRFEFPLHK
jgi:two-component sensor histidine kinase